ncbi:MAG: hypothetical protein N4A62_12370 [Marinisporobacter sp.]|jgi:hypothetical protein|nr:hypothetical protein [Marinisporobacter sp.]
MIIYGVIGSGMASIVFFLNFISILKKIKYDKDIYFNSMIGIISIIMFWYCRLLILD